MPTTMQTAEAELSKRDRLLAPIIKKYGPCPLKPHSRYYQELVESIIGQQLSVKAAATITLRFRALFGNSFPAPQQILAKPHEDLRSAGLSNAKATYIRDLATHIIQGKLDVNKLPKLNNEEVIKELVAVKGIGEWTAHMFLMFSLGRLDILPVGDLGLRVGIQKLYGLTAPPTPADVMAIAAQNNWHPYEALPAGIFGSHSTISRFGA